MAIQQEIGKREQIRDTCRQDKIDPRPNTMKMPALYAKIDMVIIMPRNVGSLETKCNQFSFDVCFQIETFNS